MEDGARVQVCVTVCLFVVVVVVVLITNYMVQKLYSIIQCLYSHVYLTLSSTMQVSHCPLSH